MKIATLFSGIGSPEQAAKRVYLDHEVVFACEFDKFARQSYEANYDIAPEHFHKDVHDLDATQYKGMVDILIGGSPCQAFSIAGLRHGTEDERGQLIYQYIRVVEECKPEIIVYENVKGMMSITGGRTIKEFVQALRDIGYYCHYEVINTKDYGVPQNRERLFLTGFLDHDQYHRFVYAEKQKLDIRLKDVLEDNVDEKYYLTNKAIEYMNRERNGKTRWEYHQNPEDGEASCLTANMHKGIPYGVITPEVKVVGMLEGKGHDLIRRVYDTDGLCRTLTAVQGGGHEPKIQVPSATKRGYEEASVGDSINLYVPNSKTRMGRVGKQVAQTLDTACNQAVVEPMIYDDYNGKLKTDGIACTLTVNCGASAPRNGQKVVEPKIITEGYLQTKFKQRGQVFSAEGISPTLDTCTGGGRETKITESHKIRKLTPRECLRLQDFPDTFKIVVSDSQAYKQAGNSMSVNILEMIFNQIEKAKAGECKNSLLDFIGA